MAGRESDHVPMLSGARSDANCDIEMTRRFPTRSASMVAPMSTAYNADTTQETPYIHMSGPLLGSRLPANGNENVAYSVQRRKDPSLLSNNKRNRDWTGGRNENLLKSGPLGTCSNPYCTTCPPAYNQQAEAQRKRYMGSATNESRFHNLLYEDVRGWVRRLFSFVNSYFPVMNPHNNFVQQWNRFFLVSCLMAIFIDPLFFFILSVDKDHKCIVFNWSPAAAIAGVRTVTDFIYLLHMLLQFRIAYVAPESRVVGAGDFVDEPKKIALNYLRGYFLLDAFVVLPLPQVLILLVLPKYIGLSAANYAKNLIRIIVLIQCTPRIIRFLPLIAGHSSNGFIFESAWVNFVINLLMFVLAGHVVGSCWYLFGLQRVNKCLKDACVDSNLESCKTFIDCGRGWHNNSNFEPGYQSWLTNQSTGCLPPNNFTFNYGIYETAVPVTTQDSIVTRYIYSLFWGFQQISTLAGNQVPSEFVWEVLFTMGIIGLGLFLFAMLIGNIQNFLLALGRRRLDMQLRRRDVEQWMSHRRLPEDLRTHVREAERLNWAATRGVNEDSLLENLPEDIQRNIRRHLFKFLQKVRIFTLMDEPLIDSVCKKIRKNFYIEGSDILYQGGSIDKMVFIVRGTVESTGSDGSISSLSEGGICGEELLAWYLDNFSVNKDGGKIRFPCQHLPSNRTVKCVTNVEAFTLRVADLEDINAFFARFLRNPHVQGAIRYESSYWRTTAAVRIQVAWRYRKRRLGRSQGSRAEFVH